MTLRIEDNIVNNNSKMPEKKKNIDKQAETTIPIVQKEEKTADKDKPVEGFYIEKTSVPASSKQQHDPQDDEDFDTSIDPEARISINPSIALYNGTNALTDAMEQTVNRAVSEIFNNSGEAAYYKATNMIKDKQPYNCFDDINFKKRFNIYGKAVYENLKKRYDIDYSSSYITSKENSVKMDLGFNYKSKSEKTKIMLFSSLTKTNYKTKWTVPENTVPNENSETDDVVEEPVIDNSEQEENVGTDFNEEQLSNDAVVQNDIEQVDELKAELNNTLFCIYGAIKQEFKNNDFGTLSSFYINDTQIDAKTTNVDASYFYNKFMALVQGDLNVYKVASQKPITKLDFSISLNPELAYPELKKINKKNENSLQETEPSTDNVVSKQGNKKWSVEFSPTFKTESINGKTTEGLEGLLRIKGIGQDSAMKVGAFGGFATTQEDNQYHVSFGSILKYTKNFNSKQQLKTKLAVKDRYTFGQGNILTANADIMYISPKVSAEIEGKYINIAQSDPIKYLGIVGKVFYAPIKNLNLFAEASYTGIKYSYYKVGGSNVQVGAIVDF